MPLTRFDATFPEIVLLTTVAVRELPYMYSAAHAASLSDRLPEIVDVVTCALPRVNKPPPKLCVPGEVAPLSLIVLYLDSKFPPT